MASNKYTAPDGYMYTDEITYAKTVILSSLDSIDNYRLATEQEYAEVLAAQDKVAADIANSSDVSETVYELLDDII